MARLTRLDQEFAGRTVMEVHVEFRYEVHAHGTDGFMRGARQAVERNAKLPCCSGCGLHQVLIAREHALEGPVRPTGSSASTSRKAPICRSTGPESSRTSPPNSTPAHAKRSTGIPQQSACVIYS